MNVRYRVELSQIERIELKALLSGGKHASRKLKRAQILLAADAGASDEEIASLRNMFATFEDGYRSACVVDAILQSHASGGVWTKIQG